MKKAINVRTQEQYDKVMEVFEKKGWAWSNGMKPIENTNIWNNYNEDTCIDYNDKLLYGNLDYYKEINYEILSFEEFLKEEGIEEKPKYRKVYVSDTSVENVLEDKCERILITELPGKAKYKYICVNEFSEEDFNDGEEFCTSSWKYIAEIPE